MLMSSKVAGVKVFFYLLASTPYSIHIVFLEHLLCFFDGAKINLGVYMGVFFIPVYFIL